MNLKRFTEKPVRLANIGWVSEFNALGTFI